MELRAKDVSGEEISDIVREMLITYWAITSNIAERTSLKTLMMHKHCHSVTEVEHRYKSMREEAVLGAKLVRDKELVVL